MKCLTWSLSWMQAGPQTRRCGLDRGDTKVLTTVRLSIPEEAGDIEKILTERWGEPRKVTELSKTVLTWFNPEKGLRPRLKEGSFDKKDVEYSVYLPFEQLIGTQKETFGFEKTPLLGLDLAGLNEHYGDVLEVLDEEQAKKKREEMKKMFGDVIDELGDAKASTDISRRLSGPASTRRRARSSPCA